MTNHESDPSGLASRRLLLALLADAECERLGIVSSAAQVAETTTWYRARFDLLRRRELDAFLRGAQLDAAEFAAQMRTLANIAQAQRHHRVAVEQRMPRYHAVFSVREWLIRREDRGLSGVVP